MVAPRYFPEMGGVETHVHEVATRIAQHGHRVTVLTSDVSGTLPGEEVADGVLVHRVRAWPRRLDYRLAPGIYRVLARRQWDLVHVQCYHTAVAPLAMLGALRSSTPYVVTFHGGGHSSRIRTALRGRQLGAMRPLLARAAKLVAVAEFEVDHYRRRLRLPPERFVLIPNGADLPGRRPRATRPDPATPLIASIGRLERYKGHQRVIAALPHILRERPGARLWIAGDGPYADKLERLATRLGVRERVEFRAVPAGAREAMAEELAGVNVLVAASEFETHPLAAIEAAAAGCPIVVADTSGLRELADRGLARVALRASDPRSLAKAVLDELNAPAATREVELPTWDECAAALAELYESVVGAAR